MAMAIIWSTSLFLSLKIVHRRHLQPYWTDSFHVAKIPQFCCSLPLNAHLALLFIFGGLFLSIVFCIHSTIDSRITLLNPVSINAQEKHKCRLSSANPITTVYRVKYNYPNMNNNAQTMSRFQQICQNCQVPTSLVEDHAAGDLICSVCANVFLGLISALLWTYTSHIDCEILNFCCTFHVLGRLL